MIKSYPTPQGEANYEWMSPTFLKLHPGSAIHYFLDCKDTEYHTHRGDFTSHIILGGYLEEVLTQDKSGYWHKEIFERRPNTSHFMPVSIPHKIIRLIDGPCITRCEFGTKVQEPGFLRFDESGNLLHRYWNSDKWEIYTIKSIQL